MAKTSTYKTVLGFVRSWLSRRTPFFKSDDSIEGIYNYLDIPGLFPTSGQPSETELAAICSAGYEVVINLAPTSVLENSVVEEAEILAEHGVHYIHLPVDFNNPTDEDFGRFKEAVEGSEKVWVHCAANMRVSAFTYRYRVTVRGENEAHARLDLNKIWEPFGVWVDFIKVS